MSVTTLQEKRKRSQPVPKEKRREQMENVRLTGEEIARLTEPGHRKRVSELGRELVLKIIRAEESAIEKAGG
jgi:hypothetical protein